MSEPTIYTAKLPGGAGDLLITIWKDGSGEVARKLYFETSWGAPVALEVAR